MAVIINGNNTPTAGGVTYGNGSEYVNTSAGSAGGVLYSAGSSAPAFTAAGTSGQLLQSNGASAPSWVTASPAAMTLISTITASNTASASFTDMTSAYKHYIVIADYIVPSTNNKTLVLRTSTNNGSSYDSGATDYVQTIASLRGTAWVVGSNTISFFYLGDIPNTASTGGISFTLNIPNPSNASRTQVYANGYTNDTTFGNGGLIFSGYRDNTSGAVNAIQFTFDSGNIASGIFKLYGIS